MDWDKLKAFYHVARVESFTKASHTMNRSQPAVSRQVKSLEERLGVQLFTRKGQKIKLTESGEFLFKFTKRIFSEFETIESRLKAEKEVLSGTLKIAATVGYAETYITKNLPAFLKKYPGLKVSLIATDIEPELILKTADIAIRPKKEGAEGLVQDFLMHNKIGLYASQQYLDTFGVPKTIKDLDKHKLIAFGDHIDHPFEALNFHLNLGRAPDSPREAYLQMNSPQTRCLMAAAGLGIAALSESHQELDKYNLIEVLPDISHPMVDIYYIYPEYLKVHEKIKVFRDYLREVLPVATS